MVFILLPALFVAALALAAQNMGGLQVGRLYPERAGEEITYEVKLGNLWVGEARFKYKGRVDSNGRALNLLVFETRVINFADTENIYSDPGNFLPVRIEREVITLFKREYISENYDQKNHRVTITKNNGKATTEQRVISSNDVIHNAILFPYAVRDLPDLVVGCEFRVNLPKRTLRVKLVSIENLKLGNKVFQAFRFESTPKQIAVWISTDALRIPLKIEGAGVFGYTLILKSYRGQPIRSL